jgi:hypothetical protein
VARKKRGKIAAATGVAHGTSTAAAIGVAKRSRRGNKRVQREVIRRIHESYPGGVPGGKSVAAVQRKVSDKGEDRFHPSWDAVKDTLRALGYVLPKE